LQTLSGSPEASVFVGADTPANAEDRPRPEVRSGTACGHHPHEIMEALVTGESRMMRAASSREPPNGSVGLESTSDPRLSIVPSELAGTVLRTLALPEIIALRRV